MANTKRPRPRERGPRHTIAAGKGEAIEDDEAIGSWPKEELERMNEAFSAAIARAAKERS